MKQVPFPCQDTTVNIHFVSLGVLVVVLVLFLSIVFHWSSVAEVVPLGLAEVEEGEPAINQLIN